MGIVERLLGSKGIRMFGFPGRSGEWWECVIVRQDGEVVNQGNVCFGGEEVCRRQLE